MVISASACLLAGLFAPAPAALPDRLAFASPPATRMRLTALHLPRGRPHLPRPGPAQSSGRHVVSCPVQPFPFDDDVTLLFDLDPGHLREYF